MLITKSSTVTLHILFLVFLGAFPCAMCTISAAEALVAPVPFSEEAPLAIADNEAFTPYVYFFGKGTLPVIATLGANISVEELHAHLESEAV